MRSFRDRNPYAVGIASMVVIGLLVAGAFALGIFHVGERAYTVEAAFSDAAGIKTADDVRVAGVKVGRVSGISVDRRKGQVIVTMKVHDDVELPVDASAAIALETLLGTKYVRLSGEVHAPFLKDQRRRVIPIERTSTPFDVFELTRVGTRTVQQTDTEKLNTFIRQMADITEGKEEEVTQLLDGLAKVSAAINARDAQLRDLLDRADSLSGTLAEKDDTIAGLLEQSDAVLAIVARYEQQIARGLRGGAQVADELALLVRGHKSEIDGILETLHPAVDILRRRQADVDRSLAWVGTAAYGLATASAHGPWQDIYVRAVGPDVIKIIESATKP